MVCNCKRRLKIERYILGFYGARILLSLSVLKVHNPLRLVPKKSALAVFQFESWTVDLSGVHCHGNKNRERSTLLETLRGDRHAGLRRILLFSICLADEEAEV